MFKEVEIELKKRNEDIVKYYKTISEKDENGSYFRFSNLIFANDIFISENKEILNLFSNKKKIILNLIRVIKNVSSGEQNFFENIKIYTSDLNRLKEEYYSSLNDIINISFEENSDNIIINTGGFKS